LYNYITRIDISNASFNFDVAYTNKAMNFKDYLNRQMKTYEEFLNNLQDNNYSLFFNFELELPIRSAIKRQKAVKKLKPIHRVTTNKLSQKFKGLSIGNTETAAGSKKIKKRRSKRKPKKRSKQNGKNNGNKPNTNKGSKKKRKRLTSKKKKKGY